MMAMAIGPPPMSAADMSELKIRNWMKSWENPATMPKTPPTMLVTTSVSRRPMLRPASQAQNGPAGTTTNLPKAARMPRWLLCKWSAAAIEGNSVVVRPCSVLSTTVMPVSVAGSASGAAPDVPAGSLQLRWY